MRELTKRQASAPAQAFSSIPIKAIDALGRDASDLIKVARKIHPVIIHERQYPLAELIEADGTELDENRRRLYQQDRRRRWLEKLERDHEIVDVPPFPDTALETITELQAMMRPATTGQIAHSIAIIIGIYPNSRTDADVMASVGR